MEYQLYFSKKKSVYFNIKEIESVIQNFGREGSVI